LEHHVAHDALRASGAIVVPERVVDDGDLVTAGGVTSGIDLGLYLVERWFGEAASKKVGVLMEYPPSGGVHRTRD
jgi:transcriptional regulator GlxA family with amidase domain